MTRYGPATVVAIAGAFLAGFVFHLLYLRWSSPSEKDHGALTPAALRENGAAAVQGYRVTFEPLSSPPTSAAELPLLQVREVEKIRALAGKPARVRGRVFRIGQSAKSNTYFLNFGPSREALTAVIFASAAELFEKNKISPKNFEGKEVEIQGEIKDHPQYGLEIILENPAQIRVID